MLSMHVFARVYMCNCVYLCLTIHTCANVTHIHIHIHLQVCKCDLPLCAYTSWQVYAKAVVGRQMSMVGCAAVRWWIGWMRSGDKKKKKRKKKRG